MAGQLWEVVGGGEKGGIMVREGRELTSAELPKRLATGALVRERRLVGERLQFELVRGEGPSEGWVSLALKDKVLLTKSTKDASRPKRQPGTIKSVEPTQNLQTPGQPFFFYHQINFLDTKPTGLRMSAVFGAIDEARTDMHNACDHSAESLREVTDPHVEFGMELLPKIKDLSYSNAADGLLYTHPESRGAVKCWLRVEAQFGFPMFPFRTEEQNLFFVGKRRDSAERVQLARGRFCEAFLEDAKSVLAGEEFQEELDMFYAHVKKDHTSEHLAVRSLRKMYEPENKPFTPTVYKKVSWLMSVVYSDLWGLLYHGRSAEVIWEVNMLAGGPFADLVKDEPDPQAMAVSLPKSMDFGKTYDVFCFLDEGQSRAVYILLPQGMEGLADAVLCVCCRYAWAKAPADGRTLVSEDFDVVSRAGAVGLLKFVLGGEAAKVGKVCDTTKLPKP